MSHQKFKGKRSSTTYCKGIIPEALRQPAMDLQWSCTSPLPWIWAVETLASSNEIDICLLLDLLEKTPEISDNLGRNAREVVSLKILERFFVQGSPGNPVSSPSGEKIKLDPSDSCEDVLQRIVAQAPPSCVKSGDLDVAKWDLQPFIQHKRSSLAKYTLQQLKEEILTGNSSLISLKEQSGLTIGNQPDTGAKMNGGNCNGTAPGQDGNTNGNLLLHRDTPSKNLLSVNRKRRFANENAGGSSCENQIPPDNQSSKKHKHDVSLCPEKEHGQKNDIERVKDKAQEDVSISSDRAGRNNDGTDIVAKKNAPLRHQHSDSSLEIINCRDQNHIADTSNKCSEERCSNLGEKTHVEDLSQSEYPADEHDEVLPDEERDEVPNDNFDEGEMQAHEVDLSKLEQIVPENIQNVGDDEDVNISSGNNEFQDEETSIGTMKKTFLSSQCTYSQDSLATTDWGELNLCMKCSKGGKLLVCSSDSCPLVIHATCLGSDASYDKSGRFYCPFCAYSEAISKYTETKKMASLARKDLATFICIGAQKNFKGQSHGSRQIKQNHPEPDDGLHRSKKAKRDVASKVGDPQEKEELENERAGPSKLQSGPSRLSKGKAIALTNRTAHGLDKDNQKGKVTAKESRSRRFLWKQEMDKPGKQKSPPVNISGYVSKRNNAYENRAKTRYKKRETDFPHELKHSSNSKLVDLEQTSEDENECETSGASKYFTRVRKPKMHLEFPAIPHMRRKILPWTSAEEDALKNGVRELSQPNDRTIPWKKIMEFGAGVFEKSRTAVDLKDKWRNLCKAGMK